MIHAEILCYTLNECVAWTSKDYGNFKIMNVNKRYRVFNNFA